MNTANVLANDAIGGAIGLQHYEQWKNNFGNTGGSLSAMPIPEPASQFLILLGLVGVFRRSTRQTDD